MRRGWEIRDNDGSPPFSIERGTRAGGDLEVHVAGLHDYGEAEQIEAVLNCPRCHGSGHEWHRTECDWYDCQKCGGLPR